jgi:hypothetical protein
MRSTVFIKILIKILGNKGIPNEEVDSVMQDVLTETLFKKLSSLPEFNFGFQAT